MLNLNVLQNMQVGLIMHIKIFQCQEKAIDVIITQRLK